jgi:trehalose-6-phosphate synthase
LAGGPYTVTPVYEGVLVLSEFAGAAVELHGAILANPYDVEGLRDSLVAALALPEAERKQQLRRLVDIVERRDVAVWSEDVLAALAPTETPPPDAARGPVIAA